MPPKKKNRVPQRPPRPSFTRTSTPVQQRAQSQNAPQVTPSPASARKAAVKLPEAEPVYDDGWTDEQEITLFKAISIYRWKPAGASHSPLSCFISYFLSSFLSFFLACNRKKPISSCFNQHITLLMLMLWGNRDAQTLSNVINYQFNVQPWCFGCAHSSPRDMEEAGNLVRLETDG